ncbi:hypothetical protein EON66_10835, partial [archaeon]
MHARVLVEVAARLVCQRSPRLQMDMGVGCCVFCSALVSRQTRRTFGCDAEEQANHTNSTSTRSVDG